jgi:tRNA(adenine34) deaminase
MKNDVKFMAKCIEVSEEAYRGGDMPFGCLIIKDGEILVKAENQVIRNKDVTEHAEIVAMKEAQKKLGSMDLSMCDIYCSYEPCPMCSLMIRELRFKRVIFSLVSPVEGGFTKYKILQDKELNFVFPNHFGPVPEIVSEILSERAWQVWEEREKSKKKSQ